MVVVSYYLSFFLLFIAFPTFVHTNECKSSICGTNGPLVRFPFRIQAKQPRHCGYPGHWFLLSCSVNNDTVLQLTPSWKLSIRKIDYISQVISAYDSDGCLPRRLLSFNLSVSPFQFYRAGQDNYESTILNCSGNEYCSCKIPCLSNSHYSVYGTPSDDSIGWHMSSCTKIRDISPIPFVYLRKKQNNLELSGQNHIADLVKKKESIVNYKVTARHPKLNVMPSSNQVHFRIINQANSNRCNPGFYFSCGSSMDRPSMKPVVKILEVEEENLPVPPNPFSSAVSARKNAKMPQRRLRLEMDVIAETE
ncbi:RING/U-box superfamily protein [Euphorbia peplus]|nr:RING/U-box superfamily protein [Euphorbia peplus]